MNRIGRIAQKEAKRPWHSRCSGVELSGEARPLNHIQPKARYRGQVLGLDPEKPNVPLVLPLS